MTELAKDSFTVPGVGQQFSSMRGSSPSFSFGSSTRDALAKIYISKEHNKVMPSRGNPSAAYDLPSTISLKAGFSFGKAKRETRSAKKPVESSIDLTFALPDTQIVKYPTNNAGSFGLDARGPIKNAAILESSPQVAIGAASPGPAAYAPSFLCHDPSYFMGTRTKILAPDCQTPATVGPGSYPVKGSVGRCFNSTHENQPTVKFGKATRHSMRKTRNSADTPISLPPSIGRQPSSHKPNATRAVFGSASRDQVAKTALILTGMERGPQIPKPRLSHPELPLERDILKYS